MRATTEKQTIGRIRKLAERNSRGAKSKCGYRKKFEYDDYFSERRNKIVTIELEESIQTKVERETEIQAIKREQAEKTRNLVESHRFELE